ncbi:hypothetical protein B7463_g7068, partial [Scytalidium lignicola]
MTPNLRDALKNRVIFVQSHSGSQVKPILGLFINNEFIQSNSGETLEAINLYDESKIADVASARPEDVDIAVTTARKAFNSPEWRGISKSARGELLGKLDDLVELDKLIQATIDAWDNGKPYQDAVDIDITEVISVLRYYARWADKIFGRTIETDDAKLAYTRHESVGVCGQIIPWNYPASMAVWKLGPALACRNTVVLKPAEQTPLSALYLAALIKEAGFPPGVVNILNGYGRTVGAAIASHPGIDTIAFTGSTTTGRLIMKAAAVNLKNITVETGAIKWPHVGIMSNMGQICTTTSRLYVEESIYDEFVEGFKEFTAKTSVVGTTSAKDEGDTTSSGTAPGEKGLFVKPTILTNVKDNMTVSREEIFGPVVVIQSFKTEAEVIEKANDSQSGLAAAVFTQDIVRAHRVAATIHAGTINSSQDSSYAVPFGGYKESGIGVASMSSIS